MLGCPNIPQLGTLYTDHPGLTVPPSTVLTTIQGRRYLEANALLNGTSPISGNFPYTGQREVPLTMMGSYN